LTIELICSAPDLVGVHFDVVKQRVLRFCRSIKFVPH